MVFKAGKRLRAGLPLPILAQTPKEDRWRHCRQNREREGLRLTNCRRDIKKALVQVVTRLYLKLGIATDTDTVDGLFLFSDNSIALDDNAIHVVISPFLI